MEYLFNMIQNWLMLYGLKILAAILIVLVGRYVAKSISIVVKKILHKSHVDETLVSFLSAISYVATMIFVFIAALSQLGVHTASLVAVLGAAGLAVALSMQGSLSNFASGILMQIYKPFNIGDYIEGAGVAGVVEEPGIFTTILKTPDNRKITVPNSKLTGDNIINYSARDTRRMDLVIGVSYQDDIDKVKRVLSEVLSEEERLLKEPAPLIGLLQMADSSINFAVRPWVNTADYWAVFYDLQENIKKRFDAEGITIPFPQQDVHLYKKE